MQVESVVRFVVRLGKFARVDGIEDRAGVFQRASLSTRRRPGADPARVEEPCVRLVMRYLIGKHARVAHRVKCQEGLGETGREGCLGFGDAVFGPGHFGGVARDEVEHGLLARQFGDGRQDTTGITGEKDDVRRVVLGETGDLGIGDVFDGVGASSILRQRGIVVIGLPGCWVEDDVLQDGSEFDCIKDVWLLVGGQVDTFGVTSTFDVEDPLLAPTVFIVADQSTFWIRGKGGLAGT